MYRKQAQQSFGQWLQNVREIQEKKRSSFARALGYSNINKGCKRILRWERGEQDPEVQFHEAIQQFLSISKAQWAEKRKEYQALVDLQSLYSQAFSGIVVETERLLATHHQLLCAHLRTILDTPNFRHIQLHGLLFSMAYIHGGSTVQLGALIKTWTERHLRTEDVWVFSGGCSPLSGSNRLRGFDIQTKKTAGYRDLFPQAASEIGPMIMRCKEMGMGFSHWSLTQFLASLGIEIPKAQIYAARTLWGEYDFHTATLTIKDQVYTFPLQLDKAQQFHPTQYHVEPSWDIPAGKLVVGDLFTGQKGVYNGERWTISDIDGVWQSKPGYLVDPHGTPILRWTSDIPTMVQEKLIAIWRESLQSPKPSSASE